MLDELRLKDIMVLVRVMVRGMVDPIKYNHWIQY
jgi:hypothetical protein